MTDMTRTPRVGIFAPAFPPLVGGAESLVADITTGLARDGRVTPVVVTAHPPADDVAAAVCAAGGAVIVVDDRRPPGRLPWVHEAFHKSEALQAALEHQALDLVHAFSYDTAVAAAIIAPPAREDRVPLVATFSEITVGERSAFEHLRARFAFSLGAIDRYVALSAVYARIAREHGLSPDKLEVNRAGIDVGRFLDASRTRGRNWLGLDESATVIACPSRFKARKGQLELLDAVGRISSRQRSALHVVLAGSINSADQRYLEAIDEAAERSPLRGRIHLMRDVPRQHMPDLLAAADVVVQPSYYEGLGLAALEAMAAGVATVLTDTVGFDEIGAHGETNLYVRPRSAAELTEALETLLADGDLRQRLARAGRAHVQEHFSIDRFLEQLVGTYLEVADGQTSAQTAVGVGA